MRNLSFVYQTIATLAYSNQFNWPLSFDEVYQRLISVELAKQLIAQYAGHPGRSRSLNKPKKAEQPADALAEQPADALAEQPADALAEQPADTKVKSQLQQTLNKLFKSGIVFEQAGEYFLSSALKPQQTLTQLITQKKKNQEFSNSLRSELMQVKQALKKISWIRASGVTGALAVANTQADDDLDFLIITEDNRLWLSRLRLLFYLVVTGQKPFFFSEKKDRWCFNLWLESSALSLPSAKQSIYGAYEAKQVNWFYDCQRLSQYFYQKNQWIEKYLLHKGLVGFNQEAPACDNLRKVVKKKGFSSELKDIILTRLNKLAYLIQKKHIFKKTNVATTNLSLRQAFFHDDESYKKFIQEWQRLLQLSCEKLGRII